MTAFFYRLVAPLIIFILSLALVIIEVGRLNGRHGGHSGLEMPVIVMGSFGILVSIALFIIANFTRHRKQWKARQTDDI